MEKVKDGYIVTEDEMVEMMMGIMDRVEKLDEQRQYADDRFHDYWEEEYHCCNIPLQVRGRLLHLFPAGLQSTFSGYKTSYFRCRCYQRGIYHN